jgi:hypothetical protein
VIDADETQSGTSRVEVALDQIELSRSEVTGNAPQFVSGTVKLTGPAPAGGKEIELFSDRPDVLTLPTSVTIPPGDTTAVFDAAVQQVAERVVALITAKHKDGDLSRWAPLLIHAPGEPAEAAPSQPQPDAPGIAATPLPIADAPLPIAASRNGTADHVDPPPAASAATPTSAASSYDEVARAARAALDPAWTPTTRQSFRAALTGVIPLVPFLAVIAMLAIHSSRPPALLSLFDPFLAGSAFALAVGLLFAFLRWRVMQDTSAERANANSYDEIRERLGAVTARLSLAAERIDDDEGRQMALREVQAWRAQVVAELGVSGAGWVLGTAYINVWKLIHRAEEALLELQPVAQVVAEALYDEQRLSGSQMDGRDQLLTRLRLAVVSLDSKSMAYLNQQPVASITSTTTGTSDVPVDQTSRTVLREIRRTINDFRDDSWAGIVRARNHLMRTLTLTGLVTYFALLIGLDLTDKSTGFDPRTDTIIAAAVFYLVGALVGLFNRLSSELNGNNDMDDYGLTEARLSLTPVISGLAAIGGVYLTAMLTGTLSGIVSAGPPATALALPHAGAIMNLSQNPFGVVLAAIFGLSPTVLISTLQDQANKYRGALQSTAPHS